MIAYEPYKDITLNIHDLGGLCAHALHTKFYNPIQDYLEEQGLYFKVRGLSAARFDPYANDLKPDQSLDITPALYGGVDDGVSPDGVIIYNDKDSWARRMLLFYGRVDRPVFSRYNVYIPVRVGRWKLHEHYRGGDTDGDPVVVITKPYQLFAVPDPQWNWELYLRGIR